MKVQEVIDLFFDNAVYSLCQAEEMIDCEKVASGLNLEEHRWYSIATDVYECEDGVVGITGAFQSFSESQTWEDIGVLCGAEQYKVVTKISYEPL